MRRTNFGLLSCLVLGGVVLGGCTEDVGSGAIRTEGIYAKYEALAEGDGTTVVTAELRVGGDDGTYVVLEDGDRLVASADDSEKSMGGIDDGLRYRSSFDVDAEGTVFNVSFEREEDEDAPDSSASLPAPFTLDFADIDAGDEVVRGEGVAITWDPAASGEIAWEVSGDCIWTREGKTADDGEFTIPADEIEVTGTDEGESCDVEVKLERVEVGSVDGAFEEGGRFEAIQRRVALFRSLPHPDEEEDDIGAGGGD